jgi:hypothetical protein
LDQRHPIGFGRQSNLARLVQTEWFYTMNLGKGFTPPMKKRFKAWDEIHA